jgi:Protein of unknown function (DUF2905)
VTVERELGRFLVVLGLMTVLIGLFLSLGGRLGLGHLPGNISINRGNVRIYVPLGTCLLLSFVLTVLFRLFSSR